ncbi:MAG: type IV secretory system conjugative DNA transfer family protein, partial [Pseudomonadota bacterium]
LPIGVLEPIFERHEKPVCVDGPIVGVKGDQASALVLGPPRDDKARAFATGAIASWDSSMVSIDTKGSLCSDVARVRAARVGPQHVIDPFGCSHGVDDLRSGCNVLALAEGQPLDRVVMLCMMWSEALVQVDRQENHWDQAAQSLVYGVLLYVCLEHDQFTREQRNLTTVHRLITRKMDETLEAMLECGLCDGLISEVAAEQAEREEREASGVLSTLRRHLKWLYLPPIRRSVQGEACPIADVMDGKTGVHLCLPVMSMQPAAGWLRLMLNTTAAVAELNNDQGFQSQKNQKRCLVLVDEAAVVIGGPGSKIVQMGAQLPGLGIVLSCIFQSVSQIRHTLRDLSDSFMACFGTTLVFGARDDATLSWCESSIGSTLVEMPSNRAATLDAAVRDGGGGESSSWAVHPLLSKSEASRLIHRDSPRGLMLARISGIGWVCLTRAYADKHQAFVKLLSTKAPARRAG